MAVSHTIRRRARSSATPLFGAPRGMRLTASFPPSSRASCRLFVASLIAARAASPVPRLAIVHRHRIRLVFDDDACMRGKVVPETADPDAAPAWDMRRSAPRARARDSRIPATRGRCRLVSEHRAAHGRKSRHTDSGAPRRRAGAWFAAACAPGRGPARSARACRRNRTPAARSSA